MMPFIAAVKICFAKYVDFNGLPPPASVGVVI
jgi:hypothetical protein